MRDRGVDVRVQNVFTDSYELNDSYVSDFIRRDGTTVVLCDGGNKIREFNTLSSFLKEGDFILAHDYAVDRELFEREINRQVWNWCEITQGDIEQACIRENLLSYREDIFNNVAWTCKVKKANL